MHSGKKSLSRWIVCVCVCACVCECVCACAWICMLAGKVASGEQHSFVVCANKADEWR